MKTITVSEQQYQLIKRALNYYCEDLAETYAPQAPTKAHAEEIAAAAELYLKLDLVRDTRASIDDATFALYELCQYVTGNRGSTSGNPYMHDSFKHAMKTLQLLHNRPVTGTAWMDAKETHEHNHKHSKKDLTK